MNRVKPVFLDEKHGILPQVCSVDQNIKAHRALFTFIASSLRKPCDAFQRFGEYAELFLENRPGKCLNFHPWSCPKPKLLLTVLEFGFSVSVTRI
jgi:hypothetical protein